MAGKNIKAELENPFKQIEDFENVKWEGDYYYEPIEINVVGKDGEEKVEHKLPRRRVFERYKPLKEIAVEIAKALYKNAYNDEYKDADICNLSYKEIRKKGLTFFMSSKDGG